MAFFQEIKIRFDWLTTAKVLTGGVILLVFLHNAWTTLDPDLGWHIRVGQTILEDREVPRQDELSFTMPGHPWVDHEWLVDMLLAFAYNNNAWFLAIIFFALASFIPFLFWLMRANRIIALFPVLLAGVMFSRFASVRPQLISFALFFLVFTLIFRLERENKSLAQGNYILIFPFIFFIWANLHAGFFSGIILILLYIASKSVYSNINKTGYNNFSKDLLVFAACLGATMVNPYGIGIYREIFAASTSNLTLGYISEWRPVFTHTGASLIIFNLLVSVFLFSLFAYFRKFSPAAVFVSLFFLIAGIKSYRMVQFFIIAAMPVIFAGIENFVSGFKGDFPFRKREKTLVEAFILFIFLVIFSLKMIAPSRGFDYPPEAANFLGNYARTKNEIRIFNDYGWGGYLALRTPEMKMFIDGRMPHWKDGENSAMADYVEVVYKENWKNIFEKRKINLVLLSKRTEDEPSIFDRVSGLFFLEKTDHSEKIRSLSGALKENGWKVIYEDSVSVILEKV